MKMEPRISLVFNGECDAAFFTQLADGERVTVPLQQTFWAQRFGEVVNRFGIPWGINCGERQDNE